MKSTTVNKVVGPRTRMTRLKKLRTFLAGLPNRKFDMGIYCQLGGRQTKKKQDFFYNEAPTQVKDLLEGSCGTKACIAGWAVLLFAKPTEKITYDGMHERARNLLGLNPAIASDLFTAEWPSRTEGAFGHGAKARREALRGLDMLIAGKGRQFVEDVA